MVLTPQEIKYLYEEAFRYFDEKIKIPKIAIEFYPYVNIDSRIKSSNGTVYVRLAELLRNSPAQPHQALALILVAKLLGRKVPKNARNIYREYISEKDFQARAFAHKRRKGRKILTSPKGKFFDLDNIFGKLNLIYFQNEIQKPKLSWSQRKTYRRLGHHDPVHKAIIISKSLDEKSVPKFVVEFVVYHEMLHIKHPAIHKNGMRRIHTPIFKRDEQNFAYFDEAENWIDANARKIKRRAKKS